MMDLKRLSCSSDTDYELDFHMILHKIHCFCYDISMEIEFELGKIYIDVRSEDEFERGHITGAINLPILYNSERAEVGYIYKQISPDDAKQRGIEFATGKLQHFFEQVQTLAKIHGEEELVFYCARGGYRSQSVYLFFKGLGIHCMKLKGGYKAYRNLVLKELSKPADAFPKFIGINGLTGSGKTKILNRLEAYGEPVLDLERAARHKGSNLGKIGMKKEQCAQQFENDIFHELCYASKKGYCFVEMESKKIGALLVPAQLYAAYHEHTFARVWIERNIEDRINFLMRDYAETEHFEKVFFEGMEKIKKYIAGELYAKISSHFERGELRELTRLLLENYYDPLYRRSTRDFSPDFSVYNESDDATAKKIVDFKKNFCRNRF